MAQVLRTNKKLSQDLNLDQSNSTYLSIQQAFIGGRGK